MSDETPGGWVELEVRNDWERVRGLGGVIVISDDATDVSAGGPKYHHRGCPYVTLSNFQEKVLDPSAAGRRPNGRYFWVARTATARSGGARRCRHPDDPLNL
jgi:hypothetical protein